MGSMNNDLDRVVQQNAQLRSQLNRGRELPADITRRLLAAERARQSQGRTRKSTFTAPGISSMESMLREF